MIKKLLKRKGTMTISARIIRADGTIEDLGTVSKGKIKRGGWKASAGS